MPPSLRSIPSSTVALAALIALLSFIVIGVAIWARPSSGVEHTTEPFPSKSVGLVDSFGEDERDDLGRAENGTPWEIVSGSWSTDGGEATVSAPDSGPSMAVADLGAGPSTIQVTMAETAGGAGLLFRYSNPFNHWALIGAPKFATWTLQRVVDGERTDIASISPAAVEAGTTVAVSDDGETIRVFIDGVEVASERDVRLARETKVGLIASDGDSTARFDDIVAVVTAEPSAAATTTDDAEDGAGGG